MKKTVKILSLALGAAMLLGVAGCTAEEGSSGHNDNWAPRPEKTYTLTADFGTIVDPPLLKKVDMYNAGCIQPLTNYERDFRRIEDLNTSALRIDLSMGKAGGTAGQYLVSDDYDYTNYDPDTGTYEVVTDSLQYDFTQLDGIVKYLTDADVLPYMSWSYIPYPLQADGKWNDLDQNITNWQEVWEEVFYRMAKHYIDSGVQIGYHEIYNEPDLEILKCWGVFDDSFDGFLDWGDFCNGAACTPGEGVYPDMYEYGAKGIRRAYEEAYGTSEDASIGGPAFALGEIGVESWVGFLPRVLSAQLPLDFYSFHTYLDGTTWFMTDEQRAAGEKNELEKVVAGLASDPYFLKTAVHINEFSYLNESNGSTNGLNSPFNYYAGAWQTLDGLMEAVNRTSVQWIYWAQFMESTGGYDPYGLIEHVGGNIKAAYNAIKMYQDMPVWRYSSQLSEQGTGLETLVSADEDKIGILVYNTNSATDADGKTSTAGDRWIDVKLDNAMIGSGTRRVYRIDKNHGSYFDNHERAELEAEEVAEVDTDDTVWSGWVPADGVVYITINRDSSAKDFDAYENRTDFATDLKTSYYYEDRYRGLEGSRETYEDYTGGTVGSYSHFDRTNWTMYLGMGDSAGLNGSYVGQAHANGSVVVRGLPETFKVDLKTEGNIRMLDKNTTLGFRIDFYDDATGGYTKSVYFYYDGLYREGRDPMAQDSKLRGLPVYPWGTERAADEAVNMPGTSWTIDLSQYAPAGWNAATGKAVISFDMQNTGAGTRAMFTLSK